MAEERVVRAGQDRRNSRLVVEGVVPFDRKVLPQENGGGMMVYEHRDVGKGGPPRHVHHDQDEWLYVLAGDEFLVEIGDERMTLRAGECVLAPRGIAHRWAHATDSSGTLLFVAQPAGTMAEFFDALDAHGHCARRAGAALRGAWHDAARSAHGRGRVALIERRERSVANPTRRRRPSLA